MGSGDVYKRQIVFDVEANGLLDDATKIHCLSYTTDGVTYDTLFDYDGMKDLLLNQQGLIGHNIIRYDIPLPPCDTSIVLSSNLSSFWNSLGPN